MLVPRIETTPVIRHEDDKKLLCEFNVPKDSIKNYTVNAHDYTITVNFECEKSEKKDNSSYKSSFK